MAERIKKAASEKTPAPDKLEGEIRAAAQKIFENRRKKGLPGDEVSDWLAAEAEVKKKRSASKS